MAFDRQHGYPLRIRQQTCGNFEWWSLDGWTEWLPGWVFCVWPGTTRDAEVSLELPSCGYAPPCLLSCCSGGLAHIDLLAGQPQRHNCIIHVEAVLLPVLLARPACSCNQVHATPCMQALFPR